MTEQWTIEPVTKEQAGRSIYMALIAPNGKVIGMFYDPNIAKTLIKRINMHDELVGACNEVAGILEGESKEVWKYEIAVLSKASEATK